MCLNSHSKSRQCNLKGSTELNECMSVPDQKCTDGMVSLGLVAD